MIYDFQTVLFHSGLKIAHGPGPTTHVTRIRDGATLGSVSPGGEPGMWNIAYTSMEPSPEIVESFTVLWQHIHNSVAKTNTMLAALKLSADTIAALCCPSDTPECKTTETPYPFTDVLSRNQDSIAAKDLMRLCEFEHENEEKSFCKFDIKPNFVPSARELERCMKDDLLGLSVASNQMLTMAIVSMDLRSPELVNIISFLDTGNTSNTVPKSAPDELIRRCEFRKSSTLCDDIGQRTAVLELLLAGVVMSFISKVIVACADVLNGKYYANVTLGDGSISRIAEDVRWFSVACLNSAEPTNANSPCISRLINLTDAGESLDNLLGMALRVYQVYLEAQCYRIITLKVSEKLTHYGDARESLDRMTSMMISERDPGFAGASDSNEE